MKKLLMEDFRTKENLSVLFILGNGFDLNLGMKTSYTDVYSQYVQTESKSDVIKKFKEELNTNKTNKQSKWSDFELGMAKYARTLSSENELIECVWDFKGHMVEHLKYENERMRIALNRNDLRLPLFNEFNRSLYGFYKGLSPNDVNAISNALKIKTTTFIFSPLTTLPLLKKY